MGLVETVVTTMLRGVCVVTTLSRGVSVVVVTKLSTGLLVVTALSTDVCGHVRQPCSPGLPTLFRSI